MFFGSDKNAKVSKGFNKIPSTKKTFENWVQMSTWVLFQTFFDQLKQVVRGEKENNCACCFFLLAITSFYPDKKSSKREIIKNHATMSRIFRRLAQIVVTKKIKLRNRPNTAKLLHRRNVFSVFQKSDKIHPTLAACDLYTRLNPYSRFLL